MAQSPWCLFYTLRRNVCNIQAGVVKMSLDKESYLSIVQLIVFIAALCIAIFVCSRHRRRRAAGWIYTLILCVIRILGSFFFQLIAYSKKDESMLKTAVVFDSIGLSPLLFATLGRLSRLQILFQLSYPPTN